MRQTGRFKQGLPNALCEPPGMSCLPQESINTTLAHTGILTPLPTAALHRLGGQTHQSSRRKRRGDFLGAGDAKNMVLQVEHWNQP